MIVEKEFFDLGALRSSPFFFLNKRIYQESLIN